MPLFSLSAYLYGEALTRTNCTMTMKGIFHKTYCLEQTIHRLGERIELLRKTVSGTMLTLLLIGVLFWAFNIQPVKASGFVYIRANGRIDPPTTSIRSFDNVTYTFTDNIYGWITVERDNIIVDGAQHTLQGTYSESLDSSQLSWIWLPLPGIFLPEIENVTVRNTQIKNFGHGIALWRSSNCTISGNNITKNEYGIVNEDSSDNIISGNNITANYRCSIGMWSSFNNTISGNKIANEDFGISLAYCFHNSIYHNSFIGNTRQVRIREANYGQFWDDGYPSGGNYWSDYVGVDLHHGPYQNETGSDGIGDTPYFIGEDNQDNYPLMKPWSPIKTVNATIDIDPDTLNLRSRGKWITCYIELPEGYNVSDIDVTSVMLNDTVPAYPKTHAIGDYDEDGIPDLMVKFDRAEVIDYIMANVNMTKLLEEKFMTVTLTITGKLDDGTPFQGYTKIRTIAHAGLPRISTKISFTLSPNPATIGQTITLTGNLKSQLGNAIGNAPVEVYYSMDNGRNWVHAGTIHTDSAGGFSAKGKLTIVGTFLIAVVYRGNFRYSQSYRIETLMIDSST